MRRSALLAVVLLALPSVAAAAEGGTTLGIPDWIWKTVNLAAFGFFLYWFVGRPMGRFLESRRTDIAAELREAKDKLRHAEELRTQVVGRLEAVEKEVAEIRERAAAEGRAEAERIAEHAAVEAERFAARVNDEIARRSAETRQRLAAETAELTAQIARELLEKEMTADDRRRVMDRSLKALAALEKGD